MTKGNLAYCLMLAAFVFVIALATANTASAQAINCSINSDCNDGVTLTFDSCILPGTADSYCRHDLINCASAIDCGTSGFVGDTYCSDSNVFRNFLNYTCVNPETTNSYCIGSSDPTEIESCSLGCLSGMCIFEGVHDVALVDFTNSVGGIKLQNSSGYIFTGQTPQLMCNQSYQVIIKAENKGDFYENVTFNGSVDDLHFSHVSLSDFAPEAVSGEKVKTVMFNLAAGIYDIVVNAIIPSDSNLTNNPASRQIEVVCLECSTNLQCGPETNSSSFCVGDDVYTNETIPGCNSGVCENNTQTVPVEQCNDICFNGQCLTAICHEDLECGIEAQSGNNYCFNGNVYQNYSIPSCGNPGTSESVCSGQTEQRLNESCTFGCSDGACLPPPACNDNSDCGNPSVSSDFCTENNVTQNLTTPVCVNAGTQSAFCSISTTTIIDISCQFGCSNGECIIPSCIVDLDCGTDSQSANFCSNTNVVRNATTFKCENPGTAESFCSVNSTRDTLAECSLSCENGLCISEICIDLDRDGFNSTSSIGACGVFDCNDNNNSTNPSVLEICDGIDNNCNGQIDEGNVCGSSGGGGGIHGSGITAIPNETQNKIIPAFVPSIGSNETNASMISLNGNNRASVEFSYGPYLLLIILALLVLLLFVLIVIVLLKR